MESIKIDVSQKTVGRAASGIAQLLLGKNNPTARSQKMSDIKVVVENTDDLIFTGKKLFQKKHYRHTGTIGHMHEIPLSRSFENDSRDVLKRAVRGMLPKNRLLARRMKNLAIYKRSAS